LPRVAAGEKPLKTTLSISVKFVYLAQQFSIFCSGRQEMTNAENGKPFVRSESAMRRATSLLILTALCGISVGADEHDRDLSPTTQFDGVWQTTLSCENSNGALGYSFRFPSAIKNAVLHGEKGTDKEPGWLQIDGSLRPDGEADIYVQGIVGAAAMAVGQRPTGTPYGYHVAARFDGDHGEGRRVEGRPCTVVWSREK